MLCAFRVITLMRQISPGRTAQVTGIHGCSRNHANHDREEFRAVMKQQGAEVTDKQVAE